MSLTLGQFAARHGVAVRTVTRWRQRGYVVRLPDGRIDEVESDARLAARPAVYRGGVLGGNAPGVGVVQKNAEDIHKEKVQLAALRIALDVIGFLDLRVTPEELVHITNGALMGALDDAKAIARRRGCGQRSSSDNCWSPVMGAGDQWPIREEPHAAIGRRA